MLRMNQVKLRVGHTDEALRRKAADILRVPQGDVTGLQILRRSVDARKKPEIFYSYTVDVAVKNEDNVLRAFRGREELVCKAQGTAYRFPEPGGPVQEHPVVIVGTGPAGLFCGYFLALHGYRPILLERGKRVEERLRDVEAFWAGGRLDPESNVQFGEGGAGTFSDGKLNTLVKDRDGRNRAVLETFVKFGAAEEILYDAKPHIGTDALCGVVRRMREEILRLGGQVRFRSRVTQLCMEQGRVTGVALDGGERIACGQLVLAIGHSARDTLEELYREGVPMEAKAFAVGLRVEHPQSMVNASQYGTPDPGGLGAAPYKVTARAGDGRGVYSFCMCPGGYVVDASSEEGRTAVNGMSYSGRDGRNANSAVVVAVRPEDVAAWNAGREVPRPKVALSETRPGAALPGGAASAAPAPHPLAGVEFQRRLEERAYAAGGGRIPVQRYGDFKKCVEEAGHGNARSCGAMSDGTAPCGEISCGGEGDAAGAWGPQCKGAYRWADVSGILPQACNAAIVDGMEAFGRQIQGFNSPEACLSGVESRTSSPVRILREEDSLQSWVRGLYPCGEGAGYAGGILSAAMDGMRVAEAIAREYAPPRTGKEAKRDIRRAVLAARDGLGAEERGRASVLLTERILGHQWYYLSEYILCFVSFGSEIGTGEILREALRAGKKVYVPKVLCKETAEMRFYRIGSPDELEEGYGGILEPAGTSEVYPYSEEAAGRTLVLMPGVAFDGFRNRLGYGGGFYDKFLSEHSALQVRTIAVGYRCQLVEALPVSGTDVKPYQVICV